MSATTAPTSSAPAAETTGQEIHHDRNRWGQIRLYVGLAVIVVWGLAPAYWMVVTAFRDVGYTFDTSPWPTHVTLDNFRTAFDTSRGNHFGAALWHSIVIGIVTTAVAMLVGVFAAYAMSRLNFPGKFIILGVILGSSMFPGVALVTPLFQLFSNLGWLQGVNYQALIIPYISFALPLTIYTLTAFLAEMPWELEESARIDGCTPGQAFRKIMLPLAAPGLFTTAILVFIASWNEFLLASQFSTKYTQTVTVAIASFTGAQPHQEPYTAIMAAGTIVTVPLIIMVLVFQRWIVSGLTAGGVKG
ncbi:Binding-protein-dependent transport systems inner membrane component [Nostocoides japonicum T1-X7]|uniref:Binding-protein-dependent transport systems inner membrane component n=1 Tax=Nostocoides japonicum T1-X7 TaxID=1194083 RepID=A0A077LUB1_9MICO|nr:carbohydrate ABC transporter permease [Tetrasphaera japonica]CCH77086.1 Binding-protein-dependent transport systems inner membrane component [Tetrasphaera japonica T1-X7]